MLTTIVVAWALLALLVILVVMANSKNHRIDVLSYELRLEREYGQLLSADIVEAHQLIELMIANNLERELGATVITAEQAAQIDSRVDDLVYDQA